MTEEKEVNLVANKGKGDDVTMVDVDVVNPPKKKANVVKEKSKK